MTNKMPTLFLSHGSPTLVFDDDAAHRFLVGLAQDLPRPRAILVVSAHWETQIPALSLAPQPQTIHDFGGFAPELYELHYPAPGAPALAERSAQLLEAAGFAVARHPSRGLDHGAWVPLMLLYPDADISVTQLSVQTRMGPEHHLRLGRALAPLRDEGVLIIASGAATHSLEDVFNAGFVLDAPVPDWVAAFSDWLADAVENGRTAELLDYRAQAPFAQRNHPTEDHVLPLFVALGAAGEGQREGQGEGQGEGKAQRIHASFSFGALAMDVYAFD